MVLVGFGGAGLASVALAACGAPAPRPKPDSGWDAPSASSTATHPPATPRIDEHWDIVAQLRFLEPVLSRGRSDHRGGAFEAEVLATKGAGYPPRGPTSVAARGTTVVERLFASGTSEPVALLVMVKQSPGFDPPGADWEYLVVTPEGRVEERGKLSSCGRCHAEAPHDRLFGSLR